MRTGPARSTATRKHTQELRNNAPNPEWQNHLHSAILDNPITREMYMRRVRTLADRYLAIPKTSLYRHRLG